MLKRVGPELTGMHSGLRGNCIGLFGDCSGLSGDCSWLFGDLDACGITNEMRANGVDIESLVEE